MAPTIAIDARVLGTGRSSGVENYTESLLERMLPMAPEVQFKLFYSGSAQLPHRSWMALPNVQIFKAGYSNRLLSASTRVLGRPYLDELIGGADAFFFPHFIDGATSASCKRILVIHDLSFERFPEFFSFNRRVWHKVQMRPRIQIQKADKIIAVSESTKRDIVSIYGIPEERIISIHSGLNPELVRASEQEIEIFLRGKDIPRYLLALGTLEPRKNLESLIRAFELLKDDVHLVIAGQPGWLFGAVNKLAGASKAKERIRFVGGISEQEKRLWISSASALVYPSFFEGFGFPPLEAMAGGVPAIIGANSSMLEVCGGAALAVDPYSVTMLSAAMNNALHEPTIRSELIKRGYERAGNFSWEKTAERTLEAIFSTLDLS